MLDEPCGVGWLERAAAAQSPRLSLAGRACDGTDLFYDAAAVLSPFPSTLKDFSHLQTFLNATCAAVTCWRRRRCPRGALSCRCCQTFRCLRRPRTLEDPDFLLLPPEDKAIHALGRLSRAGLPRSGAKRLPELSDERAAEEVAPLVYRKTENWRRRFEFGRYHVYDRPSISSLRPRPTKAVVASAAAVAILSNA